MPTTTDDIPDAIKTLVTAEPTPVKRLKHMWISGLSKPDGHVMLAAVKDSEPELTLLDLDHAIGLPGPASPLLTQALAAELMRYGQGPQVVVTPAAEGVRLNLIGKDYAPLARRRAEPEPDSNVDFIRLRLPDRVAADPGRSGRVRPWLVLEYRGRGARLSVDNSARCADLQAAHSDSGVLRASAFGGMKSIRKSGWIG
jgi:hypothetical protein